MGRNGGIQERLQGLGRPDELEVERNRIGQGKCLDSRNEQLKSGQKLKKSKRAARYVTLARTYMTVDWFNVGGDGLCGYRARHLEPLLG